MNVRPKILCIEDDPATCELLTEVLQDEGFEPLIASDGDEGVKKIRERPNLILCDVDLPRMSGFDVLRLLRRSRGELRKIPFLFITAYGSRESNLLAWRLGCDDFLTKPLDFELLVEIVRRRLSHSPRTAPPPFILTDREAEAITWVAKGKSSADIAVLMHVTERTVNFHIDNVIHKAGAATRVQAAIRCALLGLVDEVADGHEIGRVGRVEQNLESELGGGHRTQRNQGGHAGARQHAVVDLQHEQGTGEHQHVDDAGQHTDGREGSFARR